MFITHFHTMELQKIDIMLMVLLYNKNFSPSAKEISTELSLDKAIIYNSIKTLSKYDLILDSNERPKKYTINQNKFKKWIKN